MDSRTATKILSTLGHEGRLSVFRLLARRAPDALQPGEIAEICGLKPSTLSAHLSSLAEAGIVCSRRSGTSLFYSLDGARTRDFTAYLLDDCCRGRPDLCAPQTGAVQPHHPKTVLFICTGNSARSILAEALLREAGGDRFVACSAGTRPSGQINPQVLGMLRRNGHDTAALRSKDLGEMQGPDAPQFDFVFTVCDHAANEECPAWPGQPISAHWGLPDPAKATGTDAEIALAFADAYRTLDTRIRAFAALPFETLDRMSLQTEADRIGKLT
ncbi:metalloregulator ArsR/SmtB family transcription factor [Rhodophyticola porphyridii]|uniref:ArsR family transcriptional regulator n=1 Tax=Rhodophyticola porphyridii TaxID=1852017 RepID=A0A3L9XXZ5_9RHOB|nr:metalloregulator ArsR/SmtB family transcription factor [Rhodophyticola porphyridii]RMA41409.1 ArsR family transcriptional regulator [Rhodophyticola porphyridii]